METHSEEASDASQASRHPDSLNRAPAAWGSRGRSRLWARREAARRVSAAVQPGRPGPRLVPAIFFTFFEAGRFPFVAAPNGSLEVVGITIGCFEIVGAGFFAPVISALTRRETLFAELRPGTELSGSQHQPHFVRPESSG